MTSSSTTARLARRHLASGTGAALTVAALIALLTAIAAFVPPAVVSILDTSTRYRLEILSPPMRDLRTSFGGVPAAGFGPEPSDTLPAEHRHTWGAWDEVLHTIMESAPDDVRAAHADAEYFVRLGAPADATETTYVALDPRFASRIRIVDGRMPTATGEAEWIEAVQELTDAMGRPVEPPPRELPITEIVLSTASAERAAWKVGETRIVGEDAGWALPVPLTLVGTFDPADSDDPYWTRATGILAPSIAVDPFGQEFVLTTGYASPDALTTVANLSGGRLTEAWYPLLADEVTSDAAPALLADLRAFVATAQPLSNAQAGPGIPALSFQSGALPALEAAVAQAEAFVALLAMLAAGPIGVAAAVLVLGCRMILEHRRPSIELLTARGASTRQLRALVGVEGLIVGVPPALIGTLAGLGLASLLVPDALTLSPVILVAPPVLALLPAVVLGASATRTRARGRADAPANRSRWRPVAEAAVILSAILATAALLLRGTGASLDPLVVVAPLLLALVACLLALRAYPAVLRPVLRRERESRGFVGMLGAARALRDPATGAAPVLALIVGIAFAVTGGILLSTLQNGALAAARAATGADLQLSSPRFDPGAVDAVAAIDGVAQVTPVDVLPATVLFADDIRSLVTVHLVDRAALDQVQAGYPPVVPADVELGDGTGEVPLLVSADVAGRVHAATSTLSIGGAPAEFAGAVPAETPLSASRAWVIADSGYAATISGDAPITVRLLVRLQPQADAAVVGAEAIEVLGPGVRADTPEAMLAELEQDPATTGLRWALIVGITLSAVLTAVAVVMTLVLGGRSRRRILTLLQTLGAPPRSGAGLIGWELAPPMIAGLVVGIAFGAALPVLLLGVVDLAPFTGGDRQPAYAADPAILLAAVGGFVLITGVFTLIALAITRRARTAAVLRTVEET